MGFNANAFFGGFLPAAVNSGSEAYGARVALDREQEYQDWYKRMVEDQARASREEMDRRNRILEQFLGISPAQPNGPADRGAAPPPAPSTATQSTAEGWDDWNQTAGYAASMQPFQSFRADPNASRYADPPRSWRR